MKHLLLFSLPPLPATLHSTDPRLPQAASAGQVFLWLLVLVLLGALIHALRANRQLRRAEANRREPPAHDPLTGLPGRGLFLEFAHKVFANANRHGSIFGLLHLSINGLDAIPRSRGDNLADRARQELARRIVGSIRQGDLLARLENDEFWVLLDSVRNRTSVKQVIERVLAINAADLALEGLDIPVGCTVGAAMFPYDGESMEELLKKAADALEKAKTQGKNGYVLCGEAEQETASAGPGPSAG